MGLVKFLLVKVVVNDKQYCCQSPGNGIAHQDSPDSRPVRNRQEDPEDTEDTYACAGHDHRNQHIAHTPESAGQDFDKNKEHIGRRDNLYDFHADFNNFRVGSKKLEKIAAQK